MISNFDSRMPTPALSPKLQSSHHTVSSENRPILHDVINGAVDDFNDHLGQNIRAQLRPHFVRLEE